MIILGIDPGSRVSGYGLIEVNGRKFRYLDSGILKFDHIDSFIDRLRVIYEETEILIDKYQPDEVALESLIYVKSVTALAKLAQARGAMVAALKTTKSFEYSPNLVKSTVSGHGHASKEAIEKVLKMTLGDIKIRRHDESDALAIALCHVLLRGRNLAPRERKNSLRNLR
jgi:crossover junction endodeoxyribonuclease RuvC